MKKLFLIVFFAGALNGKVLDRVIATVNGEGIFYSEFQERLQPYLEQIEENGSAQENEKYIKP